MRRFAVLWVLVLAVAACGEADDTSPGGAADQTDATVEGQLAGSAAVLADARAALYAGQCDSAIELYDRLLADTAWVSISPLADVVSTERDDCAAFLAVAAIADTDADLIAGYESFLSERPTSSLVHVVDDELDRLRSAGPGTVPVEPVDVAASPSGTVPVEPVDVAANPSVCAQLAETGIVDGVSRSSEQQATLLQECMASATAAEDTAQLAGLQLAFVVDQASHPDAAALTEALRANYGACGMLDRIRTSIPAPVGETLYIDTTFMCAQFSDFVGDVPGAIELYRSFIAAAADDVRIADAEAALARNMIADARANDAEQLQDIGRSGSSGSDLAQFVFRNDTEYEQTLVITGPETRFVTIEASPTSSTYTVEPLDCRTDVPSVTLDLVPGTYDILLSDEVVEAQVGTWQLDRGAAYDWCSFYVRSW